jgi:hypothetical protein
MRYLTNDINIMFSVLGLEISLHFTAKHVVFVGLFTNDAL